MGFKRFLTFDEFLFPNTSAFFTFIRRKYFPISNRLFCRKRKNKKIIVKCIPTAAANDAFLVSLCEFYPLFISYFISLRHLNCICIAFSQFCSDPLIRAPKHNKPNQNKLKFEFEHCQTCQTRHMLRLLSTDGVYVTSNCKIKNEIEFIYYALTTISDFVFILFKLKISIRHIVQIKKLQVPV